MHQEKLAYVREPLCYWSYGFYNELGSIQKSINFRWVSTL